MKSRGWFHERLPRSRAVRRALHAGTVTALFGESFMRRCPVQGLVKAPDGQCSQMVARDVAGHLLEHCYWHQKVHDGLGEATTREASIALRSQRTAL